MEQLILKQEIVEAIKKDTILYGKVAFILGVSIRSMQRILDANRPELTQAAILKLLKSHLGKTKDSDLLEPVQVPEKQTA